MTKRNRNNVWQSLREIARTQMADDRAREDAREATHAECSACGNVVPVMGGRPHETIFDSCGPCGCATTQETR